MGWLWQYLLGKVEVTTLERYLLWGIAGSWTAMKVERWL